MIPRSLAVVALLLACSHSPAAEPTTRPVSEIAKPTLITLDVKDASVKSVLDKLQKQSKFNPALVTAPAELLEGKQITIALDKVPWIEALLRICEAAELNPYNYGDRWTISPRGQQRMLGPRHVSGPAMVALHTVTTENALTYDTPTRNTRQITIAGVLAVEPTLEIDGVASVTELKLIDDLGRELPAQLGNAARGASSFATLRRDFGITATLPDGQAKRIKSLSGTFIAPALVGRQTLKIPNLLAAEGKEFPIGQGNLVVSSVRRRNGQVFEVDLVIDKGSLPESAGTRLRGTGVNIQPLQTNKADPATLRINRLSDRNGDTALTVYIQFAKAGDEDAARVLDLQWDIPTRFIDAAIPFVIEDIPLP